MVAGISWGWRWDFFLACTFLFGGKRRHPQKGSELVTSALLVQQLRLGSGRARQFGLGNYESEDASSVLFSERRAHILTVWKGVQNSRCREWFQKGFVLSCGPFTCQLSVIVVCCTITFGNVGNKKQRTVCKGAITNTSSSSELIF